jgi:hypothetical protein
VQSRREHRGYVLSEAPLVAEVWAERYAVRNHARQREENE